MTEQPTCEDRIDAELQNVADNIDSYRKSYRLREYGGGEDKLPPFHEYGLCFDYVEPLTFPEQHVGYYRYQLSYGGPSDEIRFYPDGRIVYYFMDWFDSAKRDVSKETWARWLCNEFTELGAIDWANVTAYDYGEVDSDDYDEDEDDEDNNEDNED